ncbi:MAG: hypothetical protein WCK47_12670 [bacterium]|nr:hypothetical protein [Candidatus Sumerlaeota bacterium]
MLKKKKNLPGIRLSENVNLFIVSLAIAFVAWVFAKSGQTEEARITVPVVITPNDTRVESRAVPDNIPVTLRYGRDMQSYISSENFHFEIDIGDIRTGLGLEWKTMSKPLTEKNWVANVPQRRRIELVKIGTQSNTVEVRMRYNAQPAVVEPNISGQNQLPVGLQLVTPVKVSPRDVWITGDSAIIASMPRDSLTSKILLMTDPVNVAQRIQTSLESVSIRTPPGIEIVQPPTIIAEVNIEIQEIQTERFIRGVRLEFRAVSPDAIDLDYKQKTATITVFGPQSLLSKLTPESFDVSLIRPSEEVAGATKDVPLEARFTSTVTDDIRSRVLIRSIDPKTIKIRYEARNNAPQPK